MDGSLASTPALRVGTARQTTGSSLAPTTEFDIGAIAGHLGIAKRSAERRAEREGWAYVEHTARGGRRRIYRLCDLPDYAQAAVLLATRKAEPATPRATKAGVWSEERLQSAWQRYEQVKQPLKDTAARRLQAITTVEQLHAAGTPLTKSREIVADQLRRRGEKGSPAQIYRWQEMVDGAPKDCRLALLVPGYTGRTADAEIPVEAWDIFKADYLREEAPAASACYDRLQRVAAERGWVLPCRRTFERRINAQIPRVGQILARQGNEALMRTYPAQERRKDVFHALEAVNADGHRFDVFVRFPCGTVARPTMVAWQDLYSGKLLAYRVGQTESSDQVRLAFGDMVTQYGIPSAAWLDNGRSFAAKMLTGGTATRYRFKIRAEDPAGLFTTLGVAIHWATPYHGQAKPIERAFRDLCETVAKHPAFSGAYTGNSPIAKPENYGSRAVEFLDFMRVLSEEIAAHNARIGRRSKVCDGRSFDQAFAASYAQSSIRKATSEQRRLWLLAAEGVTASRQDGSVHLLGNRYWTEALSQHAGQKLLVRFDPDHLHGSVHTYTLAGAYIDEAECVMAVGFADTQAGREHARAKKQYRRAAKQMLDAEVRMDAATVADQLPGGVPPELPPAGIVEPLFGKKRPAPISDENEPVAATGTDDRTVNLNAFLERQADAMKNRIF